MSETPSPGGVTGDRSDRRSARLDLWFESRYRKLVRGLPQTIFWCPACKGNRRRREGCATCGGFGKLTKESVQELVARRREEGARTATAMQALLGEMEQLMAQAAGRAPAVLEEYRSRLLARVMEFRAAHGFAAEAGDLVREVALHGDRIDVSEELQRLGSHVGEVRALLAGGGEVGRRMEFLLQELLREANTLGSKSPDVALSHVAVALKSCIEKLKEQAANLE